MVLPELHRIITIIKRIIIIITSIINYYYYLLQMERLIDISGFGTLRRGPRSNELRIGSGSNKTKRNPHIPSPPYPCHFSFPSMLRGGGANTP